MLGLLFRLLFSLSVVAWYSINVWNMISDYFNKEFHRLLTNNETIVDDFIDIDQCDHEEL